ncbi:GT-D fold domain-containing glycosyltransferase [Paenibacillaceae bacterium WGS1546]|uniref:GT-D fold domain-containing protein n=1 Tax=Cohnella sp. WGS1546 TaxID=3366810 RepID=UPI00372D094A
MNPQGALRVVKPGSVSRPRRPKPSAKTALRRARKKTTAPRKRIPASRRRHYRRRRAAAPLRIYEERPSDSLVANEEYDRGYQAGLIEGGERLLEEYAPPDVIIPDLTAREAMAAGIEALRDRGLPVLDSASVFEELNTALREKKPYAFIRLGDGELLTMAQETVLSIDEIKRSGAFLPYAGVTVPNLEARDELASCVQFASLVGVPMSRKPHYQPLLFAVLRAHRIDYRKLRYTSSTMNYKLEEQGLLWKLLSGRKILIVGDAAPQLGRALTDKGYEVTGIVSPVDGYGDVARVLAEATACEYDIALIAAGVSAIPIAVHLAGMGGKVTFDFGHLANKIAGLEHPERKA